ncbi:hypothetical protein CFAEC_03200 [Corynebacterium faecale]|nr:hypothetical protein CFAEC_03200 [Corynebacterium faecale]
MLLNRFPQAGGLKGEGNPISRAHKKRAPHLKEVRSPLNVGYLDDFTLEPAAFAF